MEKCRQSNNLKNAKRIENEYYSSKKGRNEKRPSIKFMKSKSRKPDEIKEISEDASRKKNKQKQNEKHSNAEITRNLVKNENWIHKNEINRSIRSIRRFKLRNNKEREFKIIKARNYSNIKKNWLERKKTKKMFTTRTKNNIKSKNNAIDALRKSKTKSKNLKQGNKKHFLGYSPKINRNTFNKNFKNNLFYLGSTQNISNAVNQNNFEMSTETYKSNNLGELLNNQINFKRQKSNINTRKKLNPNITTNKKFQKITH